MLSIEQEQEKQQEEAGPTASLALLCGAWHWAATRETELFVKFLLLESRLLLLTPSMGPQTRPQFYGTVLILDVCGRGCLAGRDLGVLQR